MTGRTTCTQDVQQLVNHINLQCLTRNSGAPELPATASSSVLTRACCFLAMPIEGGMCSSKTCVRVHWKRGQVQLKRTGQQGVASEQLTATRAGAEQPHTEAAAPPHLQAPAGQHHAVTQTRSRKERHAHTSASLTGRGRVSKHPPLHAKFKPDSWLKLTSTGTAAKSRILEQ